MKRVLPTLVISCLSLFTHAQNVWSVTGTEKKELSALDSFMQYYMKTYDLRGGQLAVARNGKILYTRGYTWAPASVPKVQPDNLFRIASLTKVITGLMIYKLVEEGKLSLTTKVQDILNLANHPNGRPLPKSPKPTDPTTDGAYFWAVTVQDLLSHKVGWDRDAKSSNDPTYGHDKEIATYYNHPLPVSKKEVAMWGASQPMQSFPGTVRHYSNFGYLLLGLVIEKITGKDYVSAVKSTLLTPSLITRPVLSATQQKNKVAKETIYTVIPAYNQPCVIGPGDCPVQYGAENNANFDSFGGWAMAAVDYVKILSNYRRHENGMPLVDAESFLSWTKTKTPTDGYTVYEHGGLLPGTWSYTASRADGVSFMVVWNTTNAKPAGFTWGNKYYETGSHSLVWNTILDKVSTWPQEDLTPEYFKLVMPRVQTPNLPKQNLPGPKF